MQILINTWRDLPHEHAGGSEVLVDRLASGLHERGHEVTLRAGGPLAPHDYRAVDGGGRFDQYLRTPLTVRRERPDVVVDVNNGVGYYSPMFADIPTVSVVHHLHTHQWPLYFPQPVAEIGRLQESWLMPRVYRSCLFVVPSVSTGDALVDLGVRRDRVRVLPMAVDDGQPTLERNPAPEPLFVALGRVTAHKRIDLLLEMWDDIRPHTGGRLLVVGDGPDLDRHRSTSHAGVEFLGRVSSERKAELLSQAWLLVHAAHWEGWGMVITEAALAGTPAVGFDVAGVRDAIDAGHTGLLATTPAEFVAAWLSLANDAAERARLGRAAQVWASSRGAADQVALLEEVLVEACDQHTGRGVPTSLPILGKGSAHFAGPAEVRASFAADSDVESSVVKLSIVIPAYNEAERLPVLLHALAAGAVDASTTEVIVVDDGSTDETAAVARANIGDGFVRSEVVVLPRNRGKGAALRAGMARIRGEVAIMMDADMATDLAAVADVLAALEAHHVVIGSRTGAEAEVRNGARHRKAMALGLNQIVRRLTHVEQTDTQCGFKGFRGPVATLLFHASMADGFGQDSEILDLAARLGLSTTSVPVQWTAVPGSKVRIVRDSLKTFAEIVAHKLGVRSVPLVAGLSVRVPEQAADVTAKAITMALRTCDAVLDDGIDAHLLLPGADVATIERVADRLLDAMPSAEIQRWSCTFDRLAEWQLGTSLTRLGVPL